MKEKREFIQPHHWLLSNYLACEWRANVIGSGSIQSGHREHKLDLSIAAIIRIGCTGRSMQLRANGDRLAPTVYLLDCSSMHRVTIERALLSGFAAGLPTFHVAANHHSLRYSHHTLKKRYKSLLGLIEAFTILVDENGIQSSEGDPAKVNGVRQLFVVRPHICIWFGFVGNFLVQNTTLACYISACSLI